MGVGDMFDRVQIRSIFVVSPSVLYSWGGDGSMEEEKGEEERTDEGLRLLLLSCFSRV